MAEGDGKAAQKAELVAVSSVANAKVERVSVPGGWLYLTSSYRNGGYSVATTFVPGTGE